jgi:hypothetical protein
LPKTAGFVLIVVDQYPILDYLAKKMGTKKVQPAIGEHEMT